MKLPRIVKDTIVFIIGAVLLIAISAVIVKVIIDHYASEISNDQYELVNNWCKEDPMLKLHLQEFVKDDKITLYEFDEIEKIKIERKRQANIDKLKDMKDIGIFNWTSSTSK